MNCPRCAAPVKGDYKYCPECACRLRQPSREPEPQAGSRGPVVLVVSAVLLVLGGILVGWLIVADPQDDVTVVIEDPRPGRLRANDINDALVEIASGILRYYRNEDVLYVPPGAAQKIVRSIPQAEREDFLKALRDDPEQLARWGATIAQFWQLSEDALEKRTQNEPVYVQDFKCMDHEVTRGQYKECLDALTEDPALLGKHAWVRRLWWGEIPAAPEGADKDTLKRYADAAEYARYLAWRYREDWWAAVLEHHRNRDNQRRTLLIDAAIEDGSLRIEDEELSEVLLPEEIDALLLEQGDEMFPPEPPPPRPSFLGPSRVDVTQPELARMKPTDAIFLMVPPSWVSVREGNVVHWSDDDTNLNLPVTDVSWWDARLFVLWARKKTSNNRLRLPNWGEWTRAFQGGNPSREPDDFGSTRLPGFKWPWGNKVDLHGCNNLNYVHNHDRARPRDVRAVYNWHGGRSSDGLTNMAGNAAEWTLNIARNWRADDQGRLFVGMSEAEEEATDRAFVCGGSFRDGLDDCTVDGRRAIFKTSRRDWVGFRLVSTSGF